MPVWAAAKSAAEHQRAGRRQSAIKPHLAHRAASRREIHVTPMTTRIILARETARMVITSNKLATLHQRRTPRTTVEIYPDNLLHI
jgi:hypothetical protein